MLYPRLVSRSCQLLSTFPVPPNNPRSPTANLFISGTRLVGMLVTSALGAGSETAGRHIFSAGSLWVKLSAAFH